MIILSENILSGLRLIQFVDTYPLMFYKRIHELKPFLLNSCEIFIKK